MEINQWYQNFFSCHNQFSVENSFHCNFTFYQYGQSKTNVTIGSFIANYILQDSGTFQLGSTSNTISFSLKYLMITDGSQYKFGNSTLDQCTRSTAATENNFFYLSNGMSLGCTYNT